MSKAITLILVFMPVLAYGQSADDLTKVRAEIVSVCTKAEIERLEERLPELKQLLRMAKRGVVNARFGNSTNMSTGERTFVSKDAKLKEIESNESSVEEITERIAKLKSGEEYFFGNLDGPLKIGQFGHFAARSGQVLQVLGDDSFLLKVWLPSSEWVTLIVKGVSTRGVTDDSGIELPAVFEVKDTETYPTALGGTNTAFVLVPLDTSTVVEYLTANRPKSGLKKKGKR
jgi:hypothetical protein